MPWTSDFICKAIASASLTLAVPAAARTAPPVMEEWCVDKMAKWAPPGRTTYEDAKEEPGAALSRYASIAHDAMSIAYDPREEPLFRGRGGRAKTLALLLAVADSESAFRLDVDRGVGKYSRGDGGKSWCLMQVQLGVPNKDGRTQVRIELTQSYWRVSSDPRALGGEDLVADRGVCFRVALHMMRNSFAACRNSPVLDRLSIYASGKDCETGRDASAVRIGKAIRWLAGVAPPLPDEDVMTALYPSPRAARRFLVSGND